VVAVLVQESGQHGGTASGPVARDIIKAYYDKKNRRTPGGTVTADDHGTAPANGAAMVAPVVAIKPDQSAVAPARSSERDPNQ